MGHFRFGGQKLPPETFVTSRHCSLVQTLTCSVASLFVLAGNETSSILWETQKEMIPQALLLNFLWA